LVIAGLNSAKNLDQTVQGVVENLKDNMTDTEAGSKAFIGAI